MSVMQFWFWRSSRDMNFTVVEDVLVFPIHSFQHCSTEATLAMFLMSFKPFFSALSESNLTKGPHFWNMLAIFLLKQIFKLKVQTLRCIKTSDVFCITDGSEGQNPLSVAIKLRQPKQVNCVLQVNTGHLTLEEGAALPFHSPVRAAELCGLSLQIPLPCALGLLIKTYSLLFSIH